MNNNTQPATAVITIRLERQLAEAIRAEAKRERMTRPAWLLRLAERELERLKKGAAA